MIAAEKAGCHGWLPDLRQGQAELVYRVRMNTFTMYNLSTVRSIAEQSNLDSLS